MVSLRSKHILLGVTGSIAAYKAAYLTRALREEGAEVRVVMTEAAQRFIGAGSMQALSGSPVATDGADDTGDGMLHIRLARWADAIVVAPLSADTLAKLARGGADNLLTAVCLSDTPLAAAPAMNQEMWEHAAVQENIRILRARGVLVWGPAHGGQACGETGPGRMLEPQEIVSGLRAMFRTSRPAERSAAAPRVMITAGPTREAVDAVRYISNRSSGKMGFALAGAAARCARTTLIAGPVERSTPPGARRIDVVSAEEMHAAVMERIADVDIFISCAAVADYRCAEPRRDKLKKENAAKFSSGIWGKSPRR